MGGFEYSQSNTSSLDDQPIQSTRTLVHSEEQLDLNDDFERQFGSVNVGAFLKQFRKQLVEYNKSKLHRELGRARWQSTTFTISPKTKKKTCVAYMDTDDVEEVYSQFTTDPVILFADICYLGDGYPKYIASSAASLFKNSKQPFTRSKKRPDFTAYISFAGHQYDVFVMEIKSPRSSLAEDDFIKLTKELMALGVPGPAVFGMWVDGASVQTLRLDLVANGLYRLIEIDNFEPVRSFDSLSKMRTTMQKLLKIKETVDLVVASITKLVKKPKANNIEQVPLTLYWTHSPYHSKRVKKVKK
ncbi:hypothetical protein G6F37_005634 [Rhizopus arrhizus]|nr:hypothetical protein G6F38_005707 [Rhizopus arrhizus]KAG1158618.1 hypothetical protein G6F37_005634 [Rhizopus arrhizus]